PTDIPIPDAMKQDKQSPWPMGDDGPHLGLALAGRFLNHTFGSVYNSGLLCLSISSETVAQLNTGLLSALIPSMKKLTFEQRAAAVAIVTRPEVPPQVHVGNGTDVNKDPHLSILLQKFALDFYAWSDDRFVRAFTYTADVTVPVNLQTAKDPKKN